MKSIVVTIMAIALSGAGVGTLSAQQRSDNRVAAITDWSVFVESDPTTCWSVSSPKESVNTRDGRVTAVNRGDILLFVSFVPSQGASGTKGQVAFTGGYKFRKGSTVKMTIDGQEFELFTVGEDDPATSQYREDEFAWVESASDDAKIISAMKRGATAKLSAVSSRGTNTNDTFSLLGFTAALEEASKRCQ